MGWSDNLNFMVVFLRSTDTFEHNVYTDGWKYSVKKVHTCYLEQHGTNISNLIYNFDKKNTNLLGGFFNSKQCDMLAMGVSTILIAILPINHHMFVADYYQMKFESTMTFYDI